MKARLAVLVVAIAIAIAGALHLARAHASHPASEGVPPELIDPTAIDPGGWWDWH
jgi:hypothetical protein